MAPENEILIVGQHFDGKSWDISEIEFVVVGRGGVQSHFLVKPKMCLVVVELGFWQKLFKIV